MTPSLTKLYSGKVRDIYEVDNDKLLIITSDRISAFDVVMSKEIPQKGRVLTAMTIWWLEKLSDIAPNHLISYSGLDDYFVQLKSDYNSKEPNFLLGRTMLVKKAQMLPIECIVRGYLSGSAYKEYKSSGTIHGEKAPEGLLESDQLPEPIFTPSTKATEGHDVNLSKQQTIDLIGKELTELAESICLTAYLRARDLSLEKGIVIADTKFELGFIDEKLSFCDEVLTPDSSRFWPLEAIQRGKTPPSFDKQPLRDWLEQTGWDKNPPPPELPDEIVQETSSRYIEAYEKITGCSMSQWPGCC
jgi:phosphoribosylaminoimidazole-succinocarboxamide synthase